MIRKLNFLTWFVVFACSFPAMANDKAKFQPALDLAFARLSRAIADPFIIQNPDIRARMVALSAKMKDPDLKILVRRRFLRTPCKDRYIAVVIGSTIKSEGIPNTIFVCSDMQNLSTDTLAQVFTHEVQHLLATLDYEATNIDILATYLGGASPFFSPYTLRHDSEHPSTLESEINELSPHFRHTIDEDYLDVMAIKTQAEYDGIRFLTSARFNEKARIESVLKKQTPAGGCELLLFKDRAGKTATQYAQENGWPDLAKELEGLAMDCPGP